MSIIFSIITKNLIEKHRSKCVGPTKQSSMNCLFWESKAQPYSLYVMHIVKNVLETHVGTILGIEEKTKNGPKAREALRT